MAATYPTAVKSFSTKSTTDVVEAAHVNDLQDEVTAIETTLRGTIPHAVTIDNTLSVTSTLAVGGVISGSALGAHAISAGGTGENSWEIKQTDAGTGNFARLKATSNAGTLQGAAYSTTFTSSGTAFASGALLQWDASGGLSIAASHASGVIRFYAGGTTERMRLFSDGAFGLVDGMTAPSATVGFAKLFVDTSDGDLKVIFGDGTTKTIVTDT